MAINVHGGTLDKVALFNRIDDPALLRDLVLKLRSVIYLPGDFICRKVRAARGLGMQSRVISLCFHFSTSQF